MCFLRYMTNENSCMYDSNTPHIRDKQLHQHKHKTNNTHKSNKVHRYDHKTVMKIQANRHTQKAFNTLVYS